MRAKPVFVIFLLFCVALLVFPQVKEVTAQGTIYIRSDGSVEGTDKIQRNGNVYTFIGDIFGVIKVQRSNFVLDGAGYTLQGNWTGHDLDEYAYRAGIDLSNNRVTEPSRHEITNVTIKNIRIIKFSYGIECINSRSHTVVGCYISECARSINQPSNVVIKNNTLDCAIFIDYTNFDNIITHNNMLAPTDYASASLVGVFLASQPTVNENYWSDYNGTDADGNGIGDTPQVINDENQDNSPLMEPAVVPDFHYTPTEMPWAAGGFFPEPESIDVPLDTVVFISFGRPPAIVELTISPEVAVKERIIEPAYFAGSRHTFYFDDLLEPSTSYTVTMIFGNPNSTRTWTFTTTSEAPQMPPIEKDDPYDLTPYYLWVIVIAIILAVIVGLYLSKIREKR